MVLEDVRAIWDFILTEKLHIPLHERHKYVLPISNWEVLVEIEGGC